MSITMQAEKNAAAAKLELEEKRRKARQERQNARRAFVRSLPKTVSYGDKQHARDLEYAKKNTLQIIEPGLLVHRCL